MYHSYEIKKMTPPMNLPSFLTYIGWVLFVLFYIKPKIKKAHEENGTIEIIKFLGLIFLSMGVTIWIAVYFFDDFVTVGPKGGPYTIHHGQNALGFAYWVMLLGIIIFGIYKILLFLDKKR